MLENRRRLSIRCRPACRVLLLCSLLTATLSCGFPSDDRLQKSAAVLKGDAFSISILVGGAFSVETGGERYTIESAFSHPGVRIGFHRLAEERGDGDPAIGIRRISETEGRVEAIFADYSILRVVRIKDHRIEVTESIQNRRNGPVGIRIEHTVLGTSIFDTLFLGGYYKSGIRNFINRLVGRTKEVSQTAENPTVYVGRSASSLGIAVRDSLFRLQLYMDSAVFGNRVKFGLRKFSLEKNGSRTFQWDIYPLAASSDYFALINRIRADWGTNFAIRGPFDFFDVVLNRELIRDQVRLKAYFQRKKAGIIALTPWLDYTNFNFAAGEFLTRADYKSLMQDAFRTIKDADPSVKVLGCIEHNLVALPDDLEKRLSDLARGKKMKGGISESSEEESDLIRKADLPYKDSLIVTERGRHVLEYFGQMRDEVKGEMGDPPFKRAIAVYSAVGNSRFRDLMEQAQFVTDDVGLDGVYIDQFSMAFDGMQRYSYEKPDGTTADIDENTGEIMRGYTDGSLAGIEARAKLVDTILSKGKIVVANTHAAAKEMQTKLIYRFLEGARGYNALSLKANREPSYYAYLAKGQLGSPIALGERPWYWGGATADDYARYVMKTIVVFLRHGLLYYCFNTEIPEKGKGSGEYGPINHMFPITPIRLGKGFVEGKERIITAVSGQFSWPQERKPTVLFFDMKGCLKGGAHVINRESDGWKVDVTLSDWEEIAIVE